MILCQKGGEKTAHITKMDKQHDILFSTCCVKHILQITLFHQATKYPPPSHSEANICLRFSPSFCISKVFVLVGQNQIIASSSGFLWQNTLL